MRKKLILVFLPLLISSSFILISLNDKPNTNKFYFKEGIIYCASTNNPFTGVYKDTTIMIEYDVVNGIMDGSYKAYFSNGRIKIKGIIKENKYEGKWTYFYKNGQVESQGYFKNNAAQGKWTWYYDNGILKETGNFLNGVKEGEWMAYNKNGEIIEQVNFFHGKKNFKLFYKNT